MATAQEGNGTRKGLKGTGSQDDDNNNRKSNLLQFEGTMLSLDELVREWNARVNRREAVLERNTKVDYTEFEQRVKERKLDSNLKKCTAFVRKTRHFQESSRPGLESDIRSLNLTKYISEIAGVIGELRIKPSDIPCLVTVCSEIHLRYRDFSLQLLATFEKVLDLGTAAVSSLSSNTRISTDLRFFSELLLAGILPKDQGSKLLIQKLQKWATVDKDGSQLMPVLVVLLRDQTDELLGILPREIRMALEDHASSSQLSRRTQSRILPEDQARLKGTLKKYFHLVKAVCIKKNDKVWGSAKYLRKLMETKGEIPENRQKFHEELSADLYKYHGYLTKLANLLDTQPPKLRYLAIDPNEDFNKALALAGEGGGGEGMDGMPLFDDEETRQFYQDLPDMVAYLFEKKNKAKMDAVSGNGGGMDSAETSSRERVNSHSDDHAAEKVNDPENESVTSDSSLDIDELDSDSTNNSDSEDSFDEDAEKAELRQVNDDDVASELEGDVLPSVREGMDNESGCEDHYSHDETAPSSSSAPVKLNFQAYLSNLKNCVNKRLIDRAAYDFVDNFKSKHCKSELARHLFVLARQRMDLLRLCARLVATLSQVYPEIGQEICELLKKDFRFLVLKRDQHRLETKLKVTRYIAELTIFSVLPKPEAFNCLKMLLQNFAHHQIEMACCFLETCGRFLYRSRETHQRMKIYLEEMLRRKTAQFMEARYAYQVDCAYHQVCPPPGGCIPKKAKSAVQAFMEFVLCYDLNRDTIERANKALRMFDWKDTTKKNMVIGILSSPWRYNYCQLDHAAALVASVKQSHPVIVQSVIENLSEVVRLGCEFESEDLNNMRMSTCQFLAHLYNFKCVTTTSLLNVLYYLISYGVTYDNYVFSRIDPPDSLYRIRVVCHVLRIVGSFMSTPRSNRRLDFFLKYFQRYYLYKRGLPLWGKEAEGKKRFPHYVEEMFEDTIRKVRDKWQFRRTMLEAEEEIRDLDKRLREKVKGKEVKRAISGERTAVVKVSADPPPPKKEVEEKPVNYADALKMSEPTKPSKQPLESVMEEEGVEEEVDDMDEFERELQALCSEGYAPSHKKKQDIPSAKAKTSPRDGECDGLEALNYGLDKVKVTVLTKQNNKPKEKTVEIGGKEEFLRTIKQREEQEKKEKMEVKTRTLQLSKRLLEEEQIENDRSMLEALAKFGKLKIQMSPNTVVVPGLATVQSLTSGVRAGGGGKGKNPGGAGAAERGGGGEGRKQGNQKHQYKKK